MNIRAPFARRTEGHFVLKYESMNWNTLLSGLKSAKTQEQLVSGSSEVPLLSCQTFVSPLVYHISPAAGTTRVTTGLGGT